MILHICRISRLKCMFHIVWTHIYCKHEYASNGHGAQLGHATATYHIGSSLRSTPDSAQRMGGHKSWDSSKDYSNSWEITAIPGSQTHRVARSFEHRDTRNGDQHVEEETAMGRGVVVWQPHRFARDRCTGHTHPLAVRTDPSDSADPSSPIYLAVCTNVETWGH